MASGVKCKTSTNSGESREKNMEKNMANTMETGYIFLMEKDCIEYGPEYTF